MYTADQNRYNTMVYRHSGHSGLQLPILSLGLWHNFGDSFNIETMTALCTTAFDHGITHFDLANNYGPPYGSAEKNFGTILESTLGRYRDELIISTKAGYDMWEGPYGNWGSRKYLIASLDQSLHRMGLDYVDIFYHHRMDPHTPLEETMGALKHIVNSGKALYVGLSNYDGPTLERATELLSMWHVPFVINQNRHNLIDRHIEYNGLLETTRKLQKGLITFSPLAQGQLTNRYLHGIPEDSRIASSSKFLSAQNLTEAKVKALQQLNELALERGQTLAQMALTWNLHIKGVTSVLIGASKVEQIIDCVGVVGASSFTTEELEKIDIITKPFIATTK